MGERGRPRGGAWVKGARFPDGAQPLKWLLGTRGNQTNFSSVIFNVIFNEIFNEIFHEIFNEI